VRNVDSHAGRLTNGSMNDKNASSSDPLKTLSPFKGPRGFSVVIEARKWSWFESPGGGGADAVLAIESRRSPDGSTRASSTPRVCCATERAEQDGGDNKFATCKKTRPKTKLAQQNTESLRVDFLTSHHAAPIPAGAAFHRVRVRARLFSRARRSPTPGVLPCAAPFGTVVAASMQEALTASYCFSRARPKLRHACRA